MDNLVGSFLNNTQMSKSYNYMEPSITRDINGAEFTESQRFGVRLMGVQTPQSGCC